MESHTQTKHKMLIYKTLALPLLTTSSLFYHCSIPTCELPRTTLKNPEVHASATKRIFNTDQWINNTDCCSQHSHPQSGSNQTGAFLNQEQQFQQEYQRAKHTHHKPYKNKTNRCTLSIVQPYNSKPKCKLPNINLRLTIKVIQSKIATRHFTQ